MKFAKMLVPVAVVAVLGTSQPVSAISNSGNVPVLLYHTAQQEGCTYSTNVLMALQQDLETLHAQGFTVVPAYWVAEWVAGVRDGSTLPDKPIAITFDDGPDTDYIDSDPAGCGVATSGAKVLSDFKSAHPTLPWYSPHASLFVIASQIARGNIGSYLNDYWWYSAQNSGLMEIYNHSVDHDHSLITSQQWDPYIWTYIPAGGYGDGVWHGTDNFNRIDSYQEADIEVRMAASYISGKTGVWPDLFAYPYGHASSYLTGTYFPGYWAEHQTFAAFCTTAAYATRSSNRYCIPRLTYRLVWNTSADFVNNVLSGAP